MLRADADKRLLAPVEKANFVQNSEITSALYQGCEEKGSLGTLNTIRLPAYLQQKIARSRYLGPTREYVQELIIRHYAIPKHGGDVTLFSARC